MPDESTTPDLVERAQQYLRTFERRDWDALMRFFAPNAVYEPSAGIKFEGVAEIRSFAEDMAAAFRDIRREIVDVLDLGVRPEDVVQLVQTSSGRLAVESAVWSSPVIELEPAG